MFTSAVINLKPRTNVILSENIPRMIHGLFFTLLNDVSGSLADRLHKENSLKPYTLSSLHGKLERDEDNDIIAFNDETYWVRVTCLTEEVTSAFLESVHSRFIDKKPLNVGSGVFDITKVSQTPKDDVRWAKTVSIKQFVDQSKTDRFIKMEFSSPTSFRQGKINFIFPLPELVFGSFYKKWSTFTSLKFDDGFIQYVKDNVIVTDYKLSTRMMKFGNYIIDGFRGECKYEIIDTSKQDYLRFINMLADFSFFCATGYKTTMGMGQTRRIISGG